MAFNIGDAGHVTEHNRITAFIDNVAQVALDSFTGTDDAKLTAAMTYASQQTYKPTIMFDNRAHSFGSVHSMNYSGVRLSGSGGSVAREFRYTNQITCPSGGLFSVTGNKDFVIQGLSFVGSGNGSFLVPSGQGGAGGVWTDLTITNCSFNSFGPLFIQAAVTRANFQYWYVNSGTDTTMALGGTDSAFFTDGVSFMSSHNNTVNVPLINTGGLSNSRWGKLYQTPQGGYGLLVDNGLMGLVFDNFTMTDWGRTDPTLKTMRAGIIINGGEGVVFNNPIIFAVNANKIDPGDITVNGGSQHVFNSPIFVKTYDGYTSPNMAAGETPPAIWTQVPISVISPISVGGRPKILAQKTAGLILCNDPSWTITTTG